MKKFSYLILLQQNSAATKSGENSLDEYIDHISTNIKSGSTELSRIKAETIQKNGTILRGGLTQFLSTPLKSDKDEIIKLIGDSIENTVQQLDASPILSSVEQSVWNILDPQDVPLQRQLVGVVKRLLKNGRAMLSDAGCGFGKQSGDVVVLLFAFDGFATVHSLKSIVDSTDPQKKNSVVNGVLHSTLISIDQGAEADKNLIVIDFEHDDDSVVDLINAKLPVLIDQFGIKQFSFSKQTLHSSLGSAYQIRFGLNVNKYPLGSVILSLVGDHQELEDAVTTHGSVIVLEQRM